MALWRIKELKKKEYGNFERVEPEILPADDEKAIRMTFYVMPSTLEKLKADAKNEQRAICRHAGIVIDRYFSGAQNGK